MTDYDHIPIETTEGYRPPSPIADRLLIGLAVVALSAGMLIAVGNLLGGDDAVSSASGSPTPSAGASRTPRPSPSPRPRREVAVRPGEPPTASPQPSYFSGWIRATADLVVRAEPRIDAREVGLLAAGALAQADEFPDEPRAGTGWLYVNAPEPPGWIATMDGDSSLVQRHTQPSYPYSGDIWQVAAGRNNFLAIGSLPGGGYGGSSVNVMASSDGAHWQASEGPAGWGDQWGPAAVAWGPAGWLMAAQVQDRDGSVVWAWASADGLHWGALGAMEGLPPDTYPAQIVATDRGYLLATADGSLWFSADGFNWRESDEPANLGGRDDWPVLAATPAGFFVWDQSELDDPVSQAAFSIDGQSWSAVEGGPAGPNRQIVGLGDRVLGMDADPATGRPRFWIGTVVRDRLAWVRQEHDPTFANARPSTMVSVGQRALVFGWDGRTDEPLVWVGDGRRWARTDLPADGFGGIPRLAAGGAAGYVVVGYRPTLRGSNPVFWHEVAHGSWAPEPSPILPLVPDPAPDECGPPPADALEFVLLDPALAADCFGAEPITFRAWASSCDGCGFGSEGGYEPAWMLGPAMNEVYLSPIESLNTWWATGVVHPSLEYDPGWTRHWLEVTGHFNDPAAAECRWTPGPSEVAYYEGRWATVLGCRQKFVLTAVSVVDGP